MKFVSEANATRGMRSEEQRKGTREKYVKRKNARQQKNSDANSAARKKLAVHEKFADGRSADGLSV